MKVTLLHNSPLYMAAHGARTCWDSGDKSDTPKMECEGLPTVTVYGECGDKDKDLIDRVGNKFRHASILEHLVYTFYIEGVSRALLQELSRHRMASPSVKSTRYTLKELKKEAPFSTLVYDEATEEELTVYDHHRASKYLVLTGESSVDSVSMCALESLRWILVHGVSNDKAKYCLPESFKSTIQWTINARSLQNFISLRSDKSALWEIQDLANLLYWRIPAEHRYLFTDSLKS